MNQVVNRAGTALASISALKAGIANVKQTLVKKGGSPYLRFQRDGAWVFGQEDNAVEPGSAWAINPMSIMHGYICWKKGDGVDNSGGPIGEHMVPAGQPLPTALEDHSAVNGVWAQQFAFQLRCLTGTDKGEQVQFKTNSVGGTGMVDKLLAELQAQLETDDENPVPVVVLDHDSYPHKQYKKIYVPVMAVKQWLPLSDDLPEVEDETLDADDDIPAPVTPAKRARSVPATKTKVAEPDEADDELAAMEAEIARRKAAKANGAAPVEDANMKRKRELEAQLAALDENGGAEEADAGEGDTPAQAAPLRRRRNT